MKKRGFLLILIAILLPSNGSAFDNKTTHKRLTQEAIDTSNLDAYLKANLNLQNGKSTYLGNNTASYWLVEGSYLEDEPMCRASNHFHNPLRNWIESGMRDEPYFVGLFCSAAEYPPENIKSSVHWGTSYTEPSPGGIKMDTGNVWDWDHAREYYYIYLTGRNFQGEVVAGKEDMRKAYFTNCFQAVGRVLHLLQDMAVPAHVRDDFRSHLEWLGITPSTLFKPKDWFCERFET